jgi:hypothetical protein
MADSVIRFIGWYHDHAIRILQDGDLWRIAFDPFYMTFLRGDQQETQIVPWEDDATYRTAEIAQQTALTLAQKKFHDQLRIDREFLREIKWRKVYED